MHASVDRRHVHEHVTVALRPGSLWTHATFAVVADLDKSRLCSVDLTHDSRANLVGELKQWLSITATSKEGPRQRARGTSRLP